VITRPTTYLPLVGKWISVWSCTWRSINRPRHAASAALRDQLLLRPRQDHSGALRIPLVVKAKENLAYHVHSNLMSSTTTLMPTYCAYNLHLRKLAETGRRLALENAVGSGSIRIQMRKHCTQAAHNCCEVRGGWTCSGAPLVGSLRVQSEGARVYLMNCLLRARSRAVSYVRFPWSPLRQDRHVGFYLPGSLGGLTPSSRPGPSGALAAGTQTRISRAKLCRVCRVGADSTLLSSRPICLQLSRSKGCCNLGPSQSLL
jgi:hypothetical protein